MTNNTVDSTVDELLLDAGHSDASDLRTSLLQLGSLARLPVPAPGAELAAMLADPSDALVLRRGLRKHRPSVVGVAVMAGMGLGVSGVAAISPSPGNGRVLASIQQLTSGWSPTWTPPPMPANPSSAHAPAVDPEGAGPVAAVRSALTASSNKAPDQSTLTRNAVGGPAAEPSARQMFAEQGATAVPAQPAARAAGEQFQAPARHMADPAVRRSERETRGRHVAETSRWGNVATIASSGQWLRKGRS
jgi:hypothetical protein